MHLFFPTNECDSQVFTNYNDVQVLPFTVDPDTNIYKIFSYIAMFMSWKTDHSSPETDEYTLDFTNQI